MQWKNLLQDEIAIKEEQIKALRRCIRKGRFPRLNDEPIELMGGSVQHIEQALASCRRTLQQFERSAEMLQVFEKTLLTFRPEGGAKPRSKARPGCLEHP